VTYVIASPCIDVKDGACQNVCPVACIYEGGRMMYIQPDECINCGLCLSVCPVEAIFEDDATPEHEAAFKAVNADFFGPTVTGWGAPGGAAPEFATTLDHPLVARAAPPTAKA
jgi:NAD-dependent dihydropyrimidine dehydrogenase PreA subunit